MLLGVVRQRTFSTCLFKFSLSLSLSLSIYIYIHVPSFLIRSAPPRSSASVCEVVLLVDYIGSFSLRNDWVRELRSVGADVVGQGGGCLGCSGV